VEILITVALGVAAFAALLLAWGWFEAGWVRLRTLTVPIPGLPRELDGLRIAHLSDFHLGVPSRGERAVERAVAWVEGRRPELVAISGDLLARPKGEAKLRKLLGRLPGAFAVLGNHDYADSRDPFSAQFVPTDLGPATLLTDESRIVELRGRRIQVAGIDPRSYRSRRAQPDRLVDPSADLRILLCHYPYVVRALTAGSFDLVLSGHLHAGQITLPYLFGKLRLAHMRNPYVEGLHETPSAMLHVSPGLGTTFVPFRFFARPEATELLLQSTADWKEPGTGEQR
jgi:predicted MPP superfamily phosphohydrolase